MREITSFIALAQPNWLVADRLKAVLLIALTWGEILRSALCFARQMTGAPEEALLEALQSLLSKIERQQFYANALIEKLEFSTARRILHLYLTNRCNLHCPQCYVNTGKPLSYELTTEEWLRVLEEFTALVGESVVSFSGGEPLLRPDFFEIAAYAKELGH